MRIVDLSHPVTTGMPVYPGDPEVNITPALSLANDTVAVAHLSLGSHSGTHLDAPSHSIEGGRTVDEIPLELLQGEALILRAPVGPHHRITSADLLDALPEQMPSIVFIATGWDRHFADDLALAHPSLSLELAGELWKRGGRVLGIDALSPDPSDDSEGGKLPVHELWLGRDGVIVENLARLTELPMRAEIILAPLRLAGVDSSPIRAMARIATDFAE